MLNFNAMHGDWRRSSAPSAQDWGPSSDEDVDVDVDVAPSPTPSLYSCTSKAAVTADLEPRGDARAPHGSPRGIEIRCVLPPRPCGWACMLSQLLFI